MLTRVQVLIRSRKQADFHRSDKEWLISGRMWAIIALNNWNVQQTCSWSAISKKTRPVGKHARNIYIDEQPATREIGATLGYGEAKAPTVWQASFVCEEIRTPSPVLRTGLSKQVCDSLNHIALKFRLSEESCTFLNSTLAGWSLR